MRLGRSAPAGRRPFFSKRERCRTKRLHSIVRAGTKDTLMIILLAPSFDGAISFLAGHMARVGLLLFPQYMPHDRGLIA